MTKITLYSHSESQEKKRKQRDFATYNLKDRTEDYSKYYSRDTNSATLSCSSYSSFKLQRIGDDTRYDSMSMHKVYAKESVQCKEENVRSENKSMKLKYLIPCLPSYLVTPFPN